MMSYKQFEAHTEEFVSQMRSIMSVKNKDYSVEDGDSMSNYTEIARWLGIPPRVVWGVLFFKHVTALSRFIRDGRVESEGVMGRFLDAANYCVLGSALVKSEETAVASEGPRWANPELSDAVENLLESIANFLARADSPTCREFGEAVGHDWRKLRQLLGQSVPEDATPADQSPGRTSTPDPSKFYSDLLINLHGLGSLPQEFKNVGDAMRKINVFDAVLANKIGLALSTNADLTVSVKWPSFIAYIEKRAEVNRASEETKAG